MGRVRVKDKFEFELLSAYDFTLAEVVELEMLLGLPMESWSAMAETHAVLFASARAADPDMLTWAEVGALRPSEVVRIDQADDEADDEAEEDADPPVAAGDQPAADSEDSSPRRSRSTSPGGTA